MIFKHINLLFSTCIHMKFTGIIKVITSAEEVNADITKQTLVLEEVSDRQSKGGVVVDFLNNSRALLEEVKVGDVVTVSINSRVNESKTQEGKYFNSLNGWKIDKAA